MIKDKRVKFFDIYLDILTMEETLQKISQIIKNKECIQHVVINVAKLVSAQKDTKLKKIINSCPLINVDGSGIILGAKLLGINIPERVAGIDLMERLIEYCQENGHSVYFFGAKENVLNKVIEIYNNKYPELKIAGYRNGYYTKEEEAAIVEDIKNSTPDILFVAMSSPTKEVFLSKYSKTLNIPFLMGVGGSLDVVAGKVKRAPLWMQKLNLEWLFRLLQEPRRMWRRYLVTNSIYAMMLTKELLKQKFNLLRISQEEIANPK